MAPPGRPQNTRSAPLQSVEAFVANPTGAHMGSPASEVGHVAYRAPPPAGMGNGGGRQQQQQQQRQHPPTAPSPPPVGGGGGGGVSVDELVQAVREMQSLLVRQQRQLETITHEVRAGVKDEIEQLWKALREQRTPRPGGGGGGDDSAKDAEIRALKARVSELERGTPEPDSRGRGPSPLLLMICS